MTSPIRYDGENVDPAPLGKPLRFEFSGRTAPTRFMKGAMTERLASWDAKDPEKSGIPTASLENLYKRWAEGGFGVVLTGNIMLDHDQIEAPGNMIVPSGATLSGPRFEGFKTLAAAGKANDTLLVAQLNHAGRQIPKDINPHPISASDVQLTADFMGMTFGKPRAATKAEIIHVVDRFASAAAYLEAAGFDGIQLHAAHGYLLAQFLSQTTNLRTDEYGGSVENRARILVEIGQAVRARTKPNFILAIKLNSVEFQEKGISGDEAREVAALLEKNSYDFIEITGGTYEKLGFEHQRESTKKREAFFIEFAEMITPALHKSKTYITGGLKSGGAMVAALDSVDGVGIARPAAQEPHLPRDILDGKLRAAIKQDLDQQDFGIMNIAAGTQMRQVGKDQRPVDLSQPDNVAAFMKDVETWKGKLVKDTAGEVFGYPDFLSAEISPYGSFPVSG